MECITGLIAAKEEDGLQACACSQAKNGHARIVNSLLSLFCFISFVSVNDGRFKACASSILLSKHIQMRFHEKSMCGPQMSTLEQLASIAHLALESKAVLS